MIVNTFIIRLELSLDVTITVKWTSCCTKSPYLGIVVLHCIQDALGETVVTSVERNVQAGINNQPVVLGVTKNILLSESFLRTFHLAVDLSK